MGLLSILLAATGVALHLNFFLGSFSWAIQKGSDKRPTEHYFFSVLVMERDQKNSILEFIAHYISEGADHIFIYDDHSTDGTLEELSCVNPKYYSVYHEGDFPLQSSQQQLVIYSQMYHRIRKYTDWLAVVDVDEFITSRALPDMTIRELLESRLNSCALISVPWILFSWGNHSHTPRNRLRSELQWRWGYDQQFAMNVTGNKFHDRVKQVEVKMIFRTSKVFKFKVHHAQFNEKVQPFICIPHIEDHMSCAEHIKEYPELSGHDLATITNTPTGRNANFTDAVEPSRQRGCPLHNRFRAGRHSLLSIALREADIDKLLLACFHYRIRSLDDWQRKIDPSRLFSEKYQDANISIANRLDIHDDFMTAKREPARIGHAAQTNASLAMSKCEL